MPEAFSAIIYGALLSSRSFTGTCTSSRSAVKVIVDCMRSGNDAHVLNNSFAQKGHEKQRISRYRRAQKYDSACAPSTLGTRLPLRSDAKTHRNDAKQPCSSLSSNTTHLRHSNSHLRLSNPNSLPMRYYAASMHSKAYSSHIQCHRMPQTAKQADFPIAQKNAAAERFRLCMPGRLSDAGDMEAAWECFDVLRISGTLADLSLNELTNFAAWVYDASPLSSRGSDILSIKAAGRLGRLHDVFLLRAESSIESELSTIIRIWTNCLAVQTYLLAGRLDKAREMITKTIHASRGQVMPQYILSLQYVFLATSQQRSLVDGLVVLAKTWPCLRDHFRISQHRQNGETRSAITRLRNSVVNAFGTIEEAGIFLQGLEEVSSREVGISIFASIYGAEESADKIFEVYHSLVSRGLSIPWEARINFFTALLSKEAYLHAYIVRKHILLIPSITYGRRELARIQRSYFISPLADSSAPDTLSLKAGSSAKARLLGCINGSPPSNTDLLSIWWDIESSDILSHPIRYRERGTELRDDEILAFARVIVENSRARLEDNVILNALESARVLDQIAKELTRRSHKRRGADHVQLPAFLWHSLILKGELSTVVVLLVKDVGGQWYPDFVRAMTQLFLAALRLHTLNEAFAYLVLLWHVVVRHLDDADGRYKGNMARESAELRRSIFTTFAGIEDPVVWIASVPKTREAQCIAAHIFFTLFGQQSYSDRAWQLFEKLQTHQLPVSYDAHIYLLKVFISQHEFDFADQVYTSLRDHYPQKTQSPDLKSKDLLHLGLNLSSLQGSSAHAEECYNEMNARGLATRGARRRLLHAYAVHGNTERVHELFHQFFPSTTKRPWSMPTERDFREVIYAHVRAGDLQGVNQWLDQMARAKIRPDLSIYNMILLAFAKSSDLTSALAVLARMYANEVHPDRISYTTVLSIMADRKDPVSAEQLYQRALDEGVQPDNVMTMCLMDAHVEAGSWRGVIRAFDYIHQSKGTNARHTTQLYNTLLKAYVLIGAPFNIVSQVFRRFRSLSLVPTVHTYSLLIQSACDSDRMDIACDLFRQLDTMPSHGKAKSHVDAYVMTILMAGFLRKGDKDKAKSVYDDMHARGLQPRAVTFGVIVQSYANERSEESIRLAEDFMRSLINSEDSQRAWLGSAPGGRSKALESVFGPLMSIYGRQLDVAAVERQFDEMLAIGGEPTLVSLTMLMDAYRRVGNFDGAQRIWTEIVEVALRISQSDVFERLPSPTHSPKTLDIPQRQANILCLPLSVYIDALAAAGRYVEIATTWRQVKDWGFTFDAHNWNHLAVALVRAGEVERAFELVERVLVPYDKQTRISVKKRRRDPITPLTFVGSAGDGADIMAGEDDESIAEAETKETEDKTPDSPMHHANRRIEAVGSATKQQRMMSPLSDIETDPAQPLHELQQMAVTWQAWRTHTATLEALSSAMTRLTAGLRVRPAVQELPLDLDPRRMSPGEALEFHTRENEEAGIILGRIYQNYPNAVRLVERRSMK